MIMDTPGNVDVSNEVEDPTDTEEFIICEQEEVDDIIEIEIPEPSPQINAPVRERITYFTCGICNISFTRQLTLTHHIRRHNNEKPEVCSYCGKAFVSQFEMKRHMRIHIGDKPYSCSYCDKNFSDHSSRRKHQSALHTGNRPYVCKVCGKAFAYSNVLQAHMTTHTGEKKHGCAKCGKKFAQAHHLRAHMRPRGSNTDTDGCASLSRK